MSVLKRFNRFALIFGAAGLILGGLITACGSGDSMMGSSQITSDQQVGTVVLLLTDGPAEEFSEVNVKVNEVTLISGEHGPVTLSTLTRTVNLLALQQVEDLFVIREDVPAGVYSKIRLHVSEPQFVKPTGEVIESKDIHLVAEGKLDLVLDHPVRVLPGETLILQLDLDAGKSILIHPASMQKYQFRPVVFVTVLDELKKRFVHVSGEILLVDPETQSFLLRHPHRIRHVTVEASQDGGMAGLIPTDRDKPDLEGIEAEDSHNDLRHLLRVVVSKDTHIFDEAGQKTDFSSLMPGKHVSVRGLLSHEGGLHVEARVIKIGRTIRLHGVITESISGNIFELTLDPGQGITGTVSVLVHDETLIFEAGTHERLGPEVLTRGRRVMVSGVLDLTEGVFRAAVIVVKPDEPVPMQLEGTIHDINLEGRTFNLSPETGPAVPVHVMPGAVILRIQQDDTGVLRIEPIRFASLMEGDKARVFGHFDRSGSPFHARVVVVQAGPGT